MCGDNGFLQFFLNSTVYFCKRKRDSNSMAQHTQAGKGDVCVEDGKAIPPEFLS